MTVAGKRIAEVPFMQAYRPIGDILANNKKQKCISQRGWQETPCDYFGFHHTAAVTHSMHGVGVLLHFQYVSHFIRF